MSNRKELNIVLNWDEVRTAYIDGVRDGKPWPEGKANASHDMARRLRQWHRDPYTGKNDKWEGGCAGDTLGWLDNGFYAKEFEHSADYVELGIKSRPAWNEEDGEADAGRLLGGYDSFFMANADRPHRPGLRLQIEYSFAWTVPNAIIREYGAWCAGLISSLETSGYDLTVDMWIYLDSLFEDQRNTRTSVLTRVKRENEVSDFTGWSALFAPTGYRQLGFLAKCLAGDKINKRARGSLGTTIAGRGWGVEYLKDQSTVKIRCNQQAYKGSKLPIDELNKQASEAGLIPKQGKRENKELDKDDDYDYDEYDHLLELLD